MPADASAQSALNRDDPPPIRIGATIWALIALCSTVELALFAADNEVVGSRLWRSLAYQNGAFWTGLLSDWRPNYAAQPWTMFLSYAFLHGGLGHLAGNMITLGILGPLVQRRVGQGGFVLLYLLSALGGAAGFAFLNQSPQPMVGASGALFGLAGALVAWEGLERQRAGRRLWPVWRVVLFLVMLNLGMWVALNGVLAWETHLAGFVVGAAVAPFWSGWPRE